MKKHWHVVAPKYSKIWGDTQIKTFGEAVEYAKLLAEQNVGMKFIIMESVGGFQNKVVESKVEIMDVEE
jgi:hypothetical protein